MDEIKNGAKEIYLAPETNESEEVLTSNEQTSEEIENEDITITLENKPKKNVRVNEIFELREANRKVYRMSDGTEQAVFYPKAVHVFDKETKVFNETDKTFEEESDGKYFVNNKNNFKAKFSREANDELFCIESGKYCVTVSAKKNGKKLKNVFEPKLCNGIVKGKNKGGALLFSGIQKGSDYEYSLDDNGVKENIIVKERSDIYCYQFAIRPENVSVKLDEANKSIVFVSNDTGEEVFFIPAPFMTDASGAVSTAVSYECKSAANGDILLDVLADSEWINAEERTLPVVIDPQICLSGSSAMTTYSWNDGYISKQTLHTIATYCNADGTNTSKRMYMSFDMPTLPRNPRIKKAELKLYQAYSSNVCYGNPKLGLYHVTGDIYTGTCTPTQDYNLIDFAKMQIGQNENGDVVSYTFDITSLADEVIKGEVSVKNLVLKMVDEATEYDNSVTLYGGTYGGEFAPQIVMTYESSYGVNTSYRTHTHELGRFGQGSIDLQCGNLMFESKDFAWAGNRMPVTVKHLYNSALGEHKYTNNKNIELNIADYGAMNMGLGWKLNVMQSIKYDSQSDTYIFTDDNGKETYFLLSDKTTECDSETQCYQLYEDSNGYQTYFDNRKNALTIGDNRYFFDDSGRLIRVVKGINEMKIHYVSDRIACVTDGAGREFEFAYNSHGNLISICAPDYSETNPNKITYWYDNNLLKKITYPDGCSAEIHYISKMPSAIILKGIGESPLYKVEYTFEGQRVTSVSEFGFEDNEFILGKSTHYEYFAASNKTMVTTVEPKDESLGETKDKVTTTIYMFNDDGVCMSEYSYNSEDVDPKYVNGDNVIASFGHINNIDNILLNHNFMGLSSWSSEPSNCGTVHISNYSYEPYAKFGKKVLRMQTNAKSCANNGVYQDTVMLEAGEYTFSTYIRIISAFKGIDNAGAYIRVTSTNGDILAESEHLSKYNTEYVRIVTPFILDTPQSVRVHLMLDGHGVAYYDAAQLERNSYANAYNMLLNSNFEHGTVGWESNSDVELSTNEHFNMSHSLKLTGLLDSENIVKQEVVVKSNKGTRETFTLSGWAKGNSLPYSERKNCEPNEFSLSAVIKYSDGSEETHTASFSPCTDEWQPATVQFAKSEYKVVSGITINCNYNHNTGVAYFDNIQLVRNSIETNLSAKDFASNDFEEEVVAAEEKIQFEELMDKYGNTITNTTFADGEQGTIYRSYEYSSDSNGDENCGNDLVGETDARGNRTVYVVDENTSRKEEIINRLGNKTAYEYDINGRTKRIVNKSSNDEVLSTVSYDYDELNNLKEITRGDDMQYSLVYNSFHNIAQIRIKDQTDALLNYTYKKGNGRIKEMSFANGNIMKATYNGDGRLIAEKWYDSAADIEPIAYYKYVYDVSGNIVRSIDIIRLKEYNYVYESGRIIRSIEYNIILDEILNVISKNIITAIDYAYDEKGMISKKTVSSGNSEMVYYTEYPENANPVTKLQINGQNVESHSKNDQFGRKVFDELQLSTGFVSRQFNYLVGKATDEHKQNKKLKSSPTTSLVSQIVLSNGTTLSYTYDAEEHITSVTEICETNDMPIVKATSYLYDELGQLIAETSNGITTKFEYDNYGNILAKGVADENGDIANETKQQYIYDVVWKDKLISFNGQEIVYDAQGNPTSYLGHTLTWEKGRQLKSFDSNIYTYNSNGIRTSKTINGIQHDFVLDGVRILKETWQGNTIMPIYDNEDSVCGITYNGVAYFFFKNLQGDIIAITNSDGDTVVRYSYDAWGKCTVTLDISGCDIADINPFRYRGYYFDKETNLYYLNSRYYDADTGRFINSDSPEYVSIQGGNLFAYGGNCPTKNADYFGFCYTPTYSEWYVNSAPTHSYGKKKDDGLLISFLRTIGMMSLVVAAFGASVLDSLADLQENFPIIEDIVSWLDAILTIAKYFYPPLTIAEVVIEVIGVLLTISKRNKTAKDWFAIIKDVVLKIIDFDILERAGKFLKGKYDKIMNYLYVL